MYLPEKEDSIGNARSSVASNKTHLMRKVVDMSGVVLCDGKQLLMDRLVSIATAMVFEMWMDRRCTCQDRRISTALTSLRASE